MTIEKTITGSGAELKIIGRLDTVMEIFDITGFADILVIE